MVLLGISIFFLYDVTARGRVRLKLADMDGIMLEVDFGKENIFCVKMCK